ncbi:MAG: hypothetical protein EKK41_26320 [Hyphomicrobiales bacterium]|nr:MAG: hypothetical protein EKK41_26320 [Hyphomicrobiales bacterium]
MAPIRIEDSASHATHRESVGATLERFFAGVAVLLLGAVVVLAAASALLHEDLGGALTLIYLLFAATVAVCLGGMSYLGFGNKKRG